MKNLNRLPQIFKLKILVLFFIITFSSLTLKAQAPYWNTTSIDTTLNFFSISDSAELFYLTHGLDTVKGSGFMEFKRWKNFWNTRISVDSNNRGGFNAYQSAINTIVNGTLCSSNFGNNPWSFIGHSTNNTTGNKHYGLGRINKIWVDAKHHTNGNVIYAGTSNGGLYKTTTGNTTNPNWVCITDGLKMPYLGVGDMAIHPDDENKIYLGTTSTTRNGSIGLWKSTDGGLNWSSTKFSCDYTNPNAIRKVEKVVISHVKVGGNNIIYIISGDKLLKSTDDVTTTPATYYDANEQEINDIVLFKDVNNTIIISVDATLDGNGDIVKPWKVLKKDDTQSQWQDISNSMGITTTPITSIELSATDANNAYIGALATHPHSGKNANMQYTISNNYGVSWSSKSSTINSGSAARFKIDLVISNSNVDVVFIGGVTMAVSTNEGASFSLSSNRATGFSGWVHADTRDLEIQTINGVDHIYSGNDGGIDFTNDNGMTWTPLYGTGLNISEIYGFDFDLKRKNLFYGTQDNGTWRQNSGNYTHYIGGDGVQVFCDNNKEPANFLIKSNDNAPFFDLFNGLSTAKVYYDNETLGWHGRHPITVCDGKGAIYLGQHPKLNKLLSTGVSTYSYSTIQDFRLLTPSPQHRIYGIGVSKSNPEIVYAGFEDVEYYFPGRRPRLFKVSNLSTTPTVIDITPNIPFKPSMGISKIVVHPLNADTLWVCYGEHMSSDGNSLSNERIYVSHDGGATFNVSKVGLTLLNSDVPPISIPMPMPITDLVYDEYTGGMYAGTDIGVYYNEDPVNTNSPWVCYNTNLPTCIITSLKIDYCNRKLLASTFGKGLLECNLASNIPVARSPITSSLLNVPVNTIENCFSNLIIQSGKTLTVNGTLRMATNTTITIQAGGKLVLDGGTITSICDKPWSGIIVEGTYNQPATSLTFHGRVNMTNGAIISNAKTAFSLAGKLPNGNVDWAKTGGQLYALNATFLNNKTDVEMLSYNPKNSTTGTYTGSATQFNNCTFKTTDATLFKWNEVNGAHIVLWEMNSINFNSCHFTDDRTHILPQNSTLPPPLLTTEIMSAGRTGILAINSEFGLYSLTGGSPTPNTFTNLKNGIRYYNNGKASKSPRIEYCEFNNCIGGIYAGGNHFSTIRSNTFNINAKSDLTDPDILENGVYGLYLDKSDGFNTEGNLFKGDFNIPSNGRFNNTGIAARNCGDIENNLYRSDFQNLNVGIEPLSHNKNAGKIEGLQFKCNTFQNHVDEVYVLDDVAYPAAIKDLGIRSEQGDFTKLEPADNSFDNNALSLNLNLNNKGNRYFYLYRNLPISANSYYPSKVTYNAISPQYNVWPNQAVNASTYDCKNTIPNWGRDEIYNHKDYANIKRGSFVPIWQQVTTAVDGGNTPGLIADVDNANNGNVTGIYNNLLTLSPYLSLHTLARLAAKETVFSPSMIKDVLVANPQAARSLWVIQTLENRNTPLSGSFMTAILAQDTVLTAYDTLQGNYASANYEYEQAIQELMFAFSLDSNTSIPQIAPFLNHPSNPNYHYQLAEMYFDVQDYTAYHSVSDSITTKFDTFNYDYPKHQSFVAFYNELQTWSPNLAEVYEKDSSKLAWLLTFANNNPKYPARLNGLLAWYDTFLVTDNVYNSDLQEQSPSQFLSKIEEIIANNAGIDLKIYPNPADNELTLNLSKEYTPNKIIIYDLNGKILSSTIWQSGLEFKLNTQFLNSGNYILAVLQVGKEPIYQKLSILKK